MGVRNIQSDCREVLPTLAADSFDCVVTSPPYWGLRDYGTATWEGGDAMCNHIGPPIMSAKTGLSHPEKKTREQLLAEPYRNVCVPYREICGKCGARRVDAQIGLEPTLEAYVETMRDVFREVRRVLKPTGTCWLNLGDCYATGAGKVGERPGGGKQGDNWQGAMTSPNRMPQAGLKPKDLCGVPWRVAFTLQADGWWLRSAIVWAKPNPMPESVTDRPTSAYEMVFLLTKSERYFYDSEAIEEPSQANHPSGNGFKRPQQISRGGRGSDNQWTDVGGSRNARNVWTIATQPFKGAHFATMPPELAERCIKAGCPKGGHVLDPFGGAGTTGLVADRLGRNATLIELNPAYRDMGYDRVRDDAPLFAEVT